MQTKVSGSSTLTANILRRIFLLYGVLAMVSMTFVYLTGGFRYSVLNTLPNILVGWIQAAAIAAILDYGRRLCIPSRRGLFYNSLFLAPALVQIWQDSVILVAYRSFDRIFSIELILLIVFALNTSLPVL